MKDLVPAIVLKVQVDVGHLFALQVQEPLEDQAVLQGVHIGNAETIEGDAGGGASPYAVEDLTPSNEADDVPNNQEVVGELRVLDHLEFVFQTLHGVRRRAGVPLLKAFPT